MGVVVMGGRIGEVDHGIATLAGDDVHALAEPVLLVRCEELLTAQAQLDAELTPSEIPSPGIGYGRFRH